MTQKRTKASLESTTEYFHSQDLGLIAYLLCSRKHELVDIDKTNKGKVLFTIRRNMSTDSEISKFWNFKSSVDAQSYFNQIKSLKNRIYSS